MEIGTAYSRLLHRLERLSGLSAHDRQLVAELPLRVANFSANQEVARHGEAPSRCTLVLGGFLYGHKRVNGSGRQITSFFVPGDIADLHTLHLAPLDHNLSALGPAVVAFMPHPAFRDMLEKSPHLTQAFWRDTFIRLAIMREWLTNWEGAMRFQGSPISSANWRFVCKMWTSPEIFPFQCPGLKQISPTPAGFPMFTPIGSYRSCGGWA